MIVIKACVLVLYICIIIVLTCNKVFILYLLLKGNPATSFQPTASDTIGSSENYQVLDNL